MEAGKPEMVTEENDLTEVSASSTVIERQGRVETSASTAGVGEQETVNPRDEVTETFT